VSTATVDVSSRESIHALVETSTAFGDITGVIHAAGVSPSQASPEAILHVDLYGTAVLLEEFGNVGALLMGPDGAFITGSDFLMDGGVTASYFFGELAPH
jgi:hypothetical protein